MTGCRWNISTCPGGDKCPHQDMPRPEAAHKARQRLRAERPVLATSTELREYQQIKGTSALHIARLAKAKLADPSP